MDMLTGDRVWNTLMEDDLFSKQPEMTREGYRPLIEALPKKLESMLNEPAAIESILKAKIVYLKSFLAKEFGQPAEAATGETEAEPDFLGLLVDMNRGFMD